MFERNFDETATVALFNLEPYIREKVAYIYASKIECII